MAKLTAGKVREMRGLYSEWKAMGGSKGYIEIAHLFGISWETARDVIKLKTWKHVL